MQGDDASAMRAGPLLLFFEEMLSCPNGLDTDGTFDQADLVSLPVTFIQALDGCTGKCRTLEAEINPFVVCTVFYFTFPAMLRLAGILPAAAQTRLLFFQMYITDGTVHPAGRQQGCGYIHMNFH
jgi:hypothetical protein